MVIVLLTIDGETIETTPEHPFYTDDGDWVPAGKLHAADKVRKADGLYGVVRSVVLVPRLQVMYNLTVAGAHTYFVGDGQWLVHNCAVKNMGNFKETGKTFWKDRKLKEHQVKEYILGTDKNPSRYDILIDDAGNVVLRTKDGVTIDSDITLDMILEYFDLE